MKITAAIDGLYEVLQACDGLQLARGFVENPDPPGVLVGWPETLNPIALLGGASDFVIPVRLFTKYSTDDDASGRRMEDLLANTPGSPFYELNNAGTLGGTVEDTAVIGIDNVGITADEPRMFTATILVQVYAT